MTLEAHITTAIGSLDLDVRLDIQPGELVALLGPNGAGKSTVLRTLAGLRPADGGRIAIDGVVVDDPAARVFVEPDARPIGYVFQDYLLFEHLSVIENVAFGLRARGVDRRTAKTHATQLLERVGLVEYAGQRPGVLSGGQAQRVALARALASGPRLLLLDEPLAALDAGTRAQVRRDLRSALDAFDGMRLLVTHDPVDAYALADRVVILEAGHVVQSGTLADVAARPRSRYVAQLIGINLFTGTIAGDVFTTVAGAPIVVADAVAGAAFAAIRPQSVSLHTERPNGSPRNAWPVNIDDIDRLGDRVRVGLDGAVPMSAEITAAALDDLKLRPGDAVWAVVKATEIETYPA